MPGVQYMKFAIDLFNLDDNGKQIVLDTELYDKLNNSIVNDKVPVALITLIGVGGDLNITGTSTKTPDANTIDQRTNMVKFAQGEFVLSASPVLMDGKKYVVLETN